MTEGAMQGELIGDETPSRILAHLASALRRSPANEGCLAGCLRSLAPFSATLRGALGSTIALLVDRGAFKRPLYRSGVRALATLDGNRATEPLARALGAADAGGLPTLSACCLARGAKLGPELARVAASRHPQLAFAAEVARSARGESSGTHSTGIAPKIRESHRIELCAEVFVPLLRGPPLPATMAPALGVLRDAERHLGRWLVLAQVASRAGDSEPLAQARSRAKEGPASTRAAWSMVAWALACEAEPAVEPPDGSRPTAELLARLSDRPSATRDLTFLFRLAARRAAIAKPMLEAAVQGTALADETAIRAALYLLRDHGRRDLRGLLQETASSSRREGLRGLATAALYDAGEREWSFTMSERLLGSRQLASATWAAILRAAKASSLQDGSAVTEERFRHVQLGWLE